MSRAERVLDRPLGGHGSTRGEPPGALARFEAAHPREEAIGLLGRGRSAERVAQGGRGTGEPDGALRVTLAMRQLREGLEDAGDGAAVAELAREDQGFLQHGPRRIDLPAVDREPPEIGERRDRAGRVAQRLKIASASAYRCWAAS